MLLFDTLAAVYEIAIKNGSDYPNKCQCIKEKVPDLATLSMVINNINDN